MRAANQRRAALGAAMLLAAALAGGCRSTGPGAPGSAPLDGTLRTIKQTGTIKLGYREQSVPFSFVGRDGRPAGYSIDLCEQVVAGIQRQLALKLAVTWVPVTVDTRIPAVVQGTIDLECGSTSNSLSRQELVDFSSMTFVDGGTLLVKQGSRITSFFDVAGKRIAVIPGTTTESALRESLMKSIPGIQLVTVKDHGEGLAAVARGAADAYASDRVILIGLAVTSRDAKLYALLEPHFSYEPYGLVMRRGDAAFRLAVNRVLARLYRSAEIETIYSRWFGPLGPPSSVLLLMYALQAWPE